MAAGDLLYRKLLAATRFFSKGWGPVSTYEKLLKINPAMVDRSQCATLLADHLHPVQVKKVRTLPEGVIYDGKFNSPLTTMFPGMLPREAEVARFEMLLPHTWKMQAKPVYIHLAGTGDHYFWRRRHLLALPTLKEANIGALLLENPYYGSRKPREQTRSQLHYVSDLFVMGLALILECMLLLHWLEKQELGPVGLTGISMGGHNCSLAASLWPKQVAVVPCLSWSTASCVFTEGVLSNAVCWDVLEEQLFYSKIGHDERRRELLKYTAEKHDWEVTAATRDESHTSVHGDRMVDSQSSTQLEQVRQKFHTGSKKDISTRGRKQSKLRSETVATLNSILDFSTHLSNFPVPLAPELAVFLAAKGDCYIPRQNVSDVRTIWPGCEVRYVDGGHVSACVLQQSQFRHALVKTMGKVLGSIAAPA